MNTKAHPHAALMLQYAQDAAETDKPWERWEVRRDGFFDWIPVTCGPYWDVREDYRRKPKPLERWLIQLEDGDEIVSTYIVPVGAAWSGDNGRNFSTVVNCTKLREVIE